MSQPVENPKLCVAKSKFVLFFYTTQRQIKVIVGGVLPLPPIISVFYSFIIIFIFGCM